MCKLLTYLQIQFPFSRLIVVLCCVFIRHIRRPEPLLLMLIVAWSTVDGFEQPRLKIIVVSSLFTSFFSSVSTFGPVDCHVPSSSHRLDYQSNRIESRSKEVDCRIHPTQSPITCCVEAHHLQQSSIARVCASSTEAVSLARQSNEQPRWQRRQQKAFGGCWAALVAIVRQFGGHRTWFRWLSWA